ncbi:BglG family transcription antiterminator [Rossellomorea arthrocnemi]|jgi:activator of the mannose operon, transcriptional antiterminator|uniref:BglG family transcription antiterminator n=1 Tax=Rossellomorea arthrocnemi TaxID=2769542 RepID=UPI00191B4089|nr:BglG family transcription antiterminator [Rossellomorea arthrocnemi]
MNERQNEILRLLIGESNQYILIRDITEQLQCSEKTVRNDLKTIHYFLEEVSSAKLLRKPGLGVCLEVDDEGGKKLFSKLHSTDLSVWKESDEERVIQIAYHLLMDASSITFQDLMNRYYVSKAVIRKDVNQIETWLKRFDIKVVTRQKVGFTLDGTEKDKRAALSRLYEMVKHPTLTQDFMKNQFSPSEFNVVNNELSHVQRTYSIQLTDESFERVILHTLLMMKRSKQGQTISISEEELSYLQNKTEYQWAAEFLKKLEPYFSLHFPDEEIAYMSLHFLGGKYRSQNVTVTESLIDNQPLLLKVLNMLVDRVSTSINIDFREDQELWEGLNVHLHSTLNRLKHGLPVSNVMLQEIKRMYPYMFDQVMLTLVEINETLSIGIPEEEAAYLALHFQSSLERLKNQTFTSKKVVLVCHMGIGMSQLLRTKIERKFHSVRVLGSIAKAELQDFFHNEEVDLVISTISLPNIQVPHIVVSPLLEKSDEERLEQWLKQDKNTLTYPHEESILLRYTNPFLVFIQQEETNKYEIIKKLASSLCSKGFVEKEYIESTMIRERMSATTIGAGIAIPHGHPNLIKQSAIAIATLKEPIEWGVEKVSLVFLLAVKNDEQKEVKQLFSEISSLSEDPKKIQSLIMHQDIMNVLSVFKNE